MGLVTNSAASSMRRGVLTQPYPTAASAQLPTPVIERRDVPGIQPASFFRNRKIGAYTDPPLPIDAQTALAQTVNALVSVVGAKEQCLEKGKVQGIGAFEERLVYLIRGCGNLTVPLCDNYVGKELAKALQSLGGPAALPRLQALKFPCLVTNRICYGLAAAAVGGPSAQQAPSYNLTVHDFPQASSEQFDNHRVPHNFNLEPANRSTLSLPNWLRAAQRQSWVTSLVWGQEWFTIWNDCATSLNDLSESSPDEWPVYEVQSVWEELWARFIEEFRELDAEVVRMLGGLGNPTFEQIRFHCTAPDAEGVPWLSMPRTFDLEDPEGYFQLVIVDRKSRNLQRTIWNLTRPTRGPKLPKAKAKSQAKKSGSDERQSAEEEVQPPTKSGGLKLMGPRLTKEEAIRSNEHRPLDKNKKPLCWDAFSHAGCSRGSNCSFQHSGPNLTPSSLDYTVRMQLARRGGLKHLKKMTEAEAKAAIAEERQKAKDAADKNIADGKAKAKAKAKARRKSKAKPRKSGGEDGTADDAQTSAEGETTEQAAEGTSTRGGARSEQEDPTGPRNSDWKVPEEYTAFAPTAAEKQLNDLVQGPDSEWQDNVHRAASVLPCPPLSLAEQQVRSNAEGAVRGCSKDLSDHMRTYLHNRVATALKTGGDPQKAIQEALAQACKEGSTSLAHEAERLLGPKQRAGSRLTATVSALSWTSTSLLPCDIGRGTVTFKGLDQRVAPPVWERFDYGDHLGLGDATDFIQPLPNTAALQSSQTESRQCMYIHVAAALAWHRSPSLSFDSPQLIQSTLELAHTLRRDVCVQARRALDTLGPSSDTMTQAEADLRMFIHDATVAHHDKDYRCFAAFPSTLLQRYCLVMCRISEHHQVTYEHISGLDWDGSNDMVLWFLLKSGHMQLLATPNQPPPPTSREILAAGWEAHLDAALQQSTSAKLHACVWCQQSSQPEKMGNSGLPERRRQPGSFGTAPLLVRNCTRAGTRDKANFNAGVWTQLVAKTRSVLLLSDDEVGSDVVPLTSLRHADVLSGLAANSALDHLVIHLDDFSAFSTVALRQVSSAVTSLLRCRCLEDPSGPRRGFRAHVTIVAPTSSPIWECPADAKASLGRTRQLHTWGRHTVAQDVHLVRSTACIGSKLVVPPLLDAFSSPAGVGGG